MIKIIYLFYIATLFGGNSFLKYSVLGLQPLIILLFFCSVYLVFNLRKKYNIRWSKVFKVGLCFEILAIIYIAFSYLGYINIFNIEGMMFDSKFIPRQSYFLVFFPVIIVLVREIVSKENSLKFIDIISIPITILITMFVFYEEVGTQLFIFWSINTLYILFFKSKKLGMIFFILVIISPLGMFNQATKLVIKVLLVIYVLLKERAIKFNFIAGILISVVIITLIPLIATNISMESIYVYDANAWWRIKFWLHELDTLKKTYFIGVGFGTPYGLDGTLNLIGRYKETIGVTVDEMIFIIGQHNSIVNIFYRLGIMGGTLFIYFNYLVFRRSIEVRNGLDLINKKIVLWCEYSYMSSLALIFFNVGLESPVYFLIYLINLSFILGFILKYDLLKFCTNTSSIFSNTVSKGYLAKKLIVHT